MKSGSEGEGCVFSNEEPLETKEGQLLVDITTEEARTLSFALYKYLLLRREEFFMHSFSDDESILRKEEDTIKGIKKKLDSFLQHNTA